MRKTLLLLVAIISPFLMTAERPGGEYFSPLVLMHATMIDATGAPPKADMSMIISGGRITGLGPSRELPVPAGARVVDATGKFLIPGLWDMHIHLDDPELWPTHVTREEKEKNLSAAYR